MRRGAHEGERLETIDHVERELDERMLVIADRDRPIGLAGIMGGASTEVGEGTTRVILESAIFHGPTIRNTARRLGLRSEASMRHEKGIGHDLPRYAVDRAARPDRGDHRRARRAGHRRQRPRAEASAPGRASTCRGCDGCSACELDAGARSRAAPSRSGSASRARATMLDVDGAVAPPGRHRGCRRRRGGRAGVRLRAHRRTAAAAPRCRRIGPTRASRDTSGVESSPAWARRDDRARAHRSGGPRAGRARPRRSGTRAGVRTRSAREHSILRPSMTPSRPQRPRRKRTPAAAATRGSSTSARSTGTTRPSRRHATARRRPRAPAATSPGSSASRSGRGAPPAASRREPADVATLKGIVDALHDGARRAASPAYRRRAGRASVIPHRHPGPTARDPRRRRPAVWLTWRGAPAHRRGMGSGRPPGRRGDRPRPSARPRRPSRARGHAGPVRPARRSRPRRGRRAPTRRRSGRSSGSRGWRPARDSSRFASSTSTTARRSARGGSAMRSPSGSSRSRRATRKSRREGAEPGPRLAAGTISGPRSGRSIVSCRSLDGAATLAPARAATGLGHIAAGGLGVELLQSLTGSIWRSSSSWRPASSSASPRGRSATC